jgi:hypothetical protein
LPDKSRLGKGYGQDVAVKLLHRQGYLLELFSDFVQIAARQKNMPRQRQWAEFDAIAHGESLC